MKRYDGPLLIPVGDLGQDQKKQFNQSNLRPLHCLRFPLPLTSPPLLQKSSLFLSDLTHSNRFCPQGQRHTAGLCVFVSGVMAKPPLSAWPDRKCFSHNKPWTQMKIFLCHSSFFAFPIGVTPSLFSPSLWVLLPPSCVLKSPLCLCKGVTPSGSLL